MKLKPTKMLVLLVPVRFSCLSMQLHLCVLAKRQKENWNIDNHMTGSLRAMSFGPSSFLT